MKNDTILFLDDDEIELLDVDESEEVITDKWKVLIVDDDEYVHTITKLSLQDFTYKKKTMNILSAFSEAEAKRVIENNPDIALVFVDVVMEEDDSGLKLVKYIRDVLLNKMIRIVLRTGQPGQAPEKNVIVDYDINDYKLKTELTTDKLFVTVVSALRSYDDLEMIELNRKGLEQIIKSSTEIFKEKSLNDFISGILTQITSILALGKDAMYIRTSGLTAKKEDGSFYVKSAIGDYQQYLNKNVDEIFDENILNSIKNAIDSQKYVYQKDGFVSYFRSHLGEENIIYMNSKKTLKNLDKELIEIFCTNISIALDNLYLDREIASTQKEIIYTLGEISEARSKETGNHVKRVAEYSKILASHLRFSEEEAEIIRLASPMHDVGKLAIPDSILNKPGKLTFEEFEIMKTHTTSGYDMLKNSKGKIMRTGAIIALQHHEKYNGTGYPQGLSGEDIHIYGRIAAVSDVFDALGSERVYKKAWPIDEILEYFRAEKGKHFDPKIIDVFFECLPEILEIRNHFKD